MPNKVPVIKSKKGLRKIRMEDALDFEHFWKSKNSSDK